MNHNEAWLLLDEFLDGALGAEARWNVAAHLDECPVCRAHVAEQARLRQAVRGQVLATPVPDLETRLRAAIAQESAHSMPPRTARIVPLAPRVAVFVGPALAAILLLLVVSGPMTVQPTAAADFTAAHFLFAQDESLFDVSGGAAQVEQWFREKAGLEVSAPDLVGWTLTGGRLVVINGQPAAQLIYEAEPDAYLSVLRYRTGASPGALASDVVNPTLIRESGAGVVSWSRGDAGTAIVAALPDRELRQIAETIAAPD
ncbi:MAG: zf-HC2 domain-containing protein [Thermomicrobiales bacterium]